MTSQRRIRILQHNNHRQCIGRRYHHQYHYAKPVSFVIGINKMIINVCILMMIIIMIVTTSSNHHHDQIHTIYYLSDAFTLLQGPKYHHRTLSLPTTTWTNPKHRTIVSSSRSSMIYRGWNMSLKNSIRSIPIRQGSSMTTTTTTMNNNEDDDDTMMDPMMMTTTMLHSDDVGINGYHIRSDSNNNNNDTTNSKDYVPRTETTTTTNQFQKKSYIPLVQDGILPTGDPSQIEFVTPDVVLHSDHSNNQKNDQDMINEWIRLNNLNHHSGHYPFAAMMQGSGPYIANHANKVVIFHIPGTIIEHQLKLCDSLLQDIALCWLLEMKIIIVVAVPYASSSSSSSSTSTSLNNNNNNQTMVWAHECHNSLKVTNQMTLRLVEEEAGYLRTELERKLNRCLRAHHGLGDHNNNGKATPEGNVVSGNFYTAHRFGTIRDINYEYTGYASETHVQNIRQVLDKKDIVLLSTVGLSPQGELVNVNGYHLAATVAASLQASKVIYIASQGSVLRCKHDLTPIQELPVSFAESITSYHQVTCSNMGFATFQKAKEQLHPSAVELLLHIAWSCWAVNHGTGRAHICNPSDGSILEELFTAKNGANTCIYHDYEIASLIASSKSHNENDLQNNQQLQKEWDAYFESASAQGQSVTYFT